MLLDGPQAASLGSLPFAAKLDVVTRSPAWPAYLVVSVDARLPAKAWERIESALLGLAGDRGSAEGLSAIQLDKFAPLDTKAIAAARRAYASTP